VDIFLSILATIAVLFLALWALLPGGFGLTNFKKSHEGWINHLASFTWGALLLVHPLALFFIWSSTLGGGEAVYWWLLLPVPLHGIFFMLFGRNVSTA